jgi:two-component system cell cycle sensor histidine kinase/response regulator CckA
MRKMKQSNKGAKPMNARLRVLILEDATADAELIVTTLERSGFDLDWQRADTEGQFLAGLEAAPDVILADYSLPHYSAPRALAAVQERGMDVPFIVVSGSIGEEAAVKLMKQGASDYLWKDRLARLGPAVTNALEQKRLRDLEHQTTEQLRLQGLAMEAAANGIVITDRQGTIRYVNPAFTAITGYSREEALGRNPRILKSGNQPPAFYQDLWETILAGKVWCGELTNRRKDESLYSTILTITPVRDNHAGVTHFIGIHQDVTQQRRLEAQFLQAQKMEAFGQLAGGVAHDFNNMLTTILGFSDLLLAGQQVKEEGRESIIQIRNAGERAAGLTRQLLAFSRKQVLQPQILDLNALVSEQEKMIRRLIGEDIQFSVRCDPHLHRICADPVQIQQVILNLVVNARDAMPTGGNLTLATRNVDLDENFARDHPKAPPGSYVLLEASDTGCGMPPEVLARLFEPFFTTKEIGKGTGLGLATVLGIVDQSGGVIDVHSQPGLGATFRIYLPQSGVSRSGKSKSSSADILPHGKETILLVEDDDGVRGLAALILRGAGYRVLEARDGDEAKAVFRERNTAFDLLLTDVVMPKTSGPQLVGQLLADTPQMKVLYMSGYLDDAVVRYGVVEQGMALLQKPLTPRSLLQKVREVLDGGVEPNPTNPTPTTRSAQP